MLLFMTACGSSSSDDSRNPAGTHKLTRISDDQYNQLLGLSDSDLVTRAQSSQLGVCNALNLGSQTDGCTSGPTYTVFLQDPGSYFPSLKSAAEASVDYVCASAWEMGYGKPFRADFASSIRLGR